MGRQARGARASSRTSSTSRRRPSRSTATGRARGRPTPARSGRSSSATPRRSSASRRSSSSRPSCSRPGRRSSTAPATASRSCARSSRAARPDVIVEDNVVAFPALTTAGVAVRADRVVQPAGDPGAGRAAGVLGAAGRRPRRSGPTFRAEYDRTHRATVGRVRRVVPRAGRRRRCPTWSSCRRREHANLYVYPRGRRLHRRAPARPDLAPARLVGAHHGPDGRAADAAHRPSRRQRAGLPLARLARVGRRRAHEAARRRAGRHPAPVHRLEGPAGRRVRPRAEHVGRGVPAADHVASAGRPGHHARRQQHDDRGVPPRQADGRPAAVLGPVRQRAAGRTRPGSASGWPRTRSRTPS